MRKSSIHIEKGNLGYCFHNTREKPTANAIFDAKNEYENDALRAIELYRQELQKRAKKYTERTGRKLPKNTITHLSAIVNLNEQHTIEDVKKIASYLEQTLGTKVFQIAVHRDEGYIDENGEKHVNYHAHLEMLGLDEEGRSVRKKIDRKYLIKLQSEVAELLNMPRGINYTKERKKRPKRLNTYEYKEHAKRSSKAIQITKKELLDEISKLRQELIKRNKELESLNKQKIYTQADYKAISELKQALNAQNVAEIAEEFYKLKEELLNKQKENETLKTELKKSKEEVRALLAQMEYLKNEIKALKKELEQIRNETKSILVEDNPEIKEIVKELNERKDQINDDFNYFYLTNAYRQYKDEFNPSEKLKKAQNLIKAVELSEISESSKNRIINKMSHALQNTQNINYSP